MLDVIRQGIPVEKSRRLSIALMAVSGALIFKGIDAFLTGISIDGSDLPQSLNWPIRQLCFAFIFGLICFVMAEIEDDPRTPEKGHPHSKPNYRQTIIVLLLMGALSFVLGGWLLIDGILSERHS